MLCLLMILRLRTGLHDCKWGCGCKWGCSYGWGCGTVVLDDNMHKYIVSLGGDGGETKWKEAFIEVSTNNLGPTFRMMGVVVSSTMVSIVGITLAGAISASGSW